MEECPEEHFAVLFTQNQENRRLNGSGSGSGAGETCTKPVGGRAAADERSDAASSPRSVTRTRGK